VLKNTKITQQLVCWVLPYLGLPVAVLFKKFQSRECIGTSAQEITNYHVIFFNAKKLIWCFFKHTLAKLYRIDLIFTLNVLVLIYITKCIELVKAIPNNFNQNTFVKILANILVNNFRNISISGQ